MGWGDLLLGLLGAAATVAVIAGAVYVVHHIITKEDVKKTVQDDAHKNDIEGQDLMSIIYKVQPNTVSIKTYNRDGEHVMDNIVKNDGQGARVQKDQKIPVRV